MDTDDPEAFILLPFLSPSEVQVLLHGLNRLEPDFDIKRHLDTFLPAEIKPMVNSLSTALLEALHSARRSEAEGPTAGWADDDEARR